MFLIFLIQITNLFHIKQTLLKHKKYFFTGFISCQIITEGPKNQTLNTGDSVDLSCKTSNQTKVKWYKDEKEVSSNENLVIDGNNLQIKNASFSVFGNYHHQNSR